MVCEVLIAYLSCLLSGTVYKYGVHSLVGPKEKKARPAQPARPAQACSSLLKPAHVCSRLLRLAQARPRPAQAQTLNGPSSTGGASSAASSAKRGQNRSQSTDDSPARGHASRKLLAQVLILPIAPSQ